MRPAALLVFLALAAPAACAPAPSGPPAGPGTGAGVDELVTTLQVDAASDTVIFTLSVTNASTAPATLSFPTAQRYDFAVLEGGREAWRWSAGRGFAQVVGTETLAPGETRSWSEGWSPPPALRGRELTAVGTLASSGHRAERRSAFRLP